MGTNNGCSKIQYGGTADPFGRSRPDGRARVYWFAPVMQERPLSHESVGYVGALFSLFRVFLPSSGHFLFKQLSVDEFPDKTSISVQNVWNR